MPEFVWSIVITKGIRAFIVAMIALLVAKEGILTHFGIHVEWSIFQDAAIAGLIGVVEMLRKSVKQKLGLKFLTALLLAGLCAGSAAAEDSAFFKVGPLSLNIPFKTASVVYMYDFGVDQNLVGGETPILTLWNRLEGTAGVVTSLQGAGAPFVGGNLLIGNLLDKFITIPPEFKIGGFGGYDFRSENAIYGLKASIQLWQ